MKTQAIIPTAGIGTRLKARTPKPLVEFCGKPLCVHTLEAFENCPAIDSIILVGHPENLLDFGNIVKQYQFKKVAKIVAGGKYRRDSVANGLSVCDQDTDMILVHDGARPLVSVKMIDDAITMCRNCEAVVTAVPVKSTIKKVCENQMTVEATIDRSRLWEIQTPQVFKKDVLVKAHAQKSNDIPTDDAMMVERLGVKVNIIHGDYRNIKITTQEDLLIAEAFYNAGHNRFMEST